MKSRSYLSLFALALALGACARSGPEGAARPAADAGVSYAEVQQIFDAKCVACHAGPDAVQGLRLGDWAALMAGSDHGEAVIPFDAANSLLVELTTQLAGGPHPAEQGAPALAEAEVDRIRRWIEAGARGPDGTVPFTDDAPRLYVANQGDASVYVVDMERHVVVRTVDLTALGFSANAKPHHVAVEPDGSHWYVSLIGENRVLKFTREGELVGQTEFEVPGMLALHPAEDLLVVGRSMTAVNPPQRLGLIRRSDMTVEELDVFFPRPHALVVDPQGRFAYSASLAENRIAGVDLATQEVELTTLPGPPHSLVQFAVSPDGQTMVAGGHVTAKVLVFDLAAAPAPVVVDTVDVAHGPWHPVYLPDGRYVYFGNKMMNSVTVLDAEEGAVEAVIRGRGLAEPHGSAVSPDGRYVYISNNNTKGTYTPRYDLGDNANVGTVVVIDTATREIVKVLEVEANATGIGR